LGRRSRSKAQQQGAAKVGVKAQQLARVNVSLEAWAEFRVRALRAQTTVADYLGDLVKKELQRPAPKAAEAPVPAVAADDSPVLVPAWEE
jgi:hypothetical protein